jgi:hypothetical protein
MLRPFARFRKRFFLFRRDWLVVDGSVCHQKESSEIYCPALRIENSGRPRVVPAARVTTTQLTRAAIIEPTQQPRAALAIFVHKLFEIYTLPGFLHCNPLILKDRRFGGLLEVRANSNHFKTLTIKYLE